MYFSLKKAFEMSDYKTVLLPQLERWIWKHVQMIPRYMGWNSIKKDNCFKYLNPYMNLLNNKKVVLYGAGRVGQDYYKLYKKLKDFELVLWVDQNFGALCDENQKIESVNEILMAEYDYILIALSNIYVAQEVKKQLIDLGIVEDKILWEMPIVLSN